LKGEHIHILDKTYLNFATQMSINQIMISLILVLKTTVECSHPQIYFFKPLKNIAAIMILINRH